MHEEVLMLVIGSLAMWTMLVIVKYPGTKPGDLAGQIFTRPDDLVQCESIPQNISKQSLSINVFNKACMWAAPRRVILDSE